MQIHWHNHLNGGHEEELSRIETKLERIVRRAGSGNDDATLDVNLKHTDTRPSFSVALSLNMRHHTLYSEKRGDNIWAAAEDAVQALLHEIDALKGKQLAKRNPTG